MGQADSISLVSETNEERSGRGGFEPPTFGIPAPINIRRVSIV